MKVPSVILFGLSVPMGAKKIYDPSFLSKSTSVSMPLKADSVTFTSQAKYLKKYSTLPDEIKKNLSPSDGVDMLKDMERVARGKVKRAKIEDKESIVYVNPWLRDYNIMVVKPSDNKAFAFYGEKIVADVIWQDKDNPNIRLIKKNR